MRHGRLDRNNLRVWTSEINCKSQLVYPWLGNSKSWACPFSGRIPVYSTDFFQIQYSLCQKLSLLRLITPLWRAIWSGAILQSNLHRSDLGWLVPTELDYENITKFFRHFFTNILPLSEIAFSDASLMILSN